MTMNPVTFTDSTEDLSMEYIRDAYVVTAAIRTRACHSCLDVLASLLGLEDDLLACRDKCEDLDMPVTTHATGCGTAIGLIPNRAFWDADLHPDKIRSYLYEWLFENLKYNPKPHDPEKEKLVFMLDEYHPITSQYPTILLEVLNDMQAGKLPSVSDVYVVGNFS